MDGKNPFEDLRKRLEAEGKTQRGPMGTQQHLDAARKLLYARNSSEARNVASFMRLTNFAWSGISFALLFAFSMSALYKYFKKKPVEVRFTAGDRNDSLNFSLRFLRRSTVRESEQAVEEGSCCTLASAVSRDLRRGRRETPKRNARKTGGQRNRK
jgi:hypothetical protein